MRFKNLEELPTAIQRAILNDPYSMGDADISVTKLIDAPQIRKLRLKHDSEITQDARRQVASLIGKAFHALMEQHGAGNGRIVEERLTITVAGKKLSGAMDLQEVEDGPVDILDYKTWTARQLGYEKPEVEAQLNVYAHLCRQHGKQVRSLTAIAVLKDWHEASAGRDKSYPQSPVIQIKLPLWPAEVAAAYVEHRMGLHFQEAVPECTEQERWIRGTKYAVIKEGAKRASAVFEDKKAAQELWMKTEDSRIEKRPGLPIRCTRNYCDVAKFCPQFQKEKKDAGEIE